MTRLNTSDDSAHGGSSCSSPSACSVIPPLSECPSCHCWHGGTGRCYRCELYSPNASLEREERSDDTLQDLVCCENCGGSGVISYNQNLNPNSFAGTATGKCTRCGGTGIEETANATAQGRAVASTLQQIVGNSGGQA